MALTFETVPPTATAFSGIARLFEGLREGTRTAQAGSLRDGGSKAAAAAYVSTESAAAARGHWVSLRSATRGGLARLSKLPLLRRRYAFSICADAWQYPHTRRSRRSKARSTPSPSQRDGKRGVRDQCPVTDHSNTSASERRHCLRSIRSSSSFPRNILRRTRVQSPNDSAFVAR